VHHLNKLHVQQLTFFISPYDRIIAGCGDPLATIVAFSALIKRSDFIILATNPSSSIYHNLFFKQDWKIF
jgi:hypothetical protein